MDQKGKLEHEIYNHGDTTINWTPNIQIFTRQYFTKDYISTHNATTTKTKKQQKLTTANIMKVLVKIFPI